MTAPRIDTVRRTLNQVVHALGLTLEHLDDLHALAYDRHRAAEQLRVRGGAPDYSLDNHGDPQARAAYEQLATTAPAATQALLTAIGTAMTTFDPGQIRSRRDQTADATGPEVIEAIAAQQRRHATGQTGSVATISQPLPRGAARALDAHRLQTELDALRNAVRKSGIRPDRARLTPLELNAWQAATGTTTKRKKGRSGPR